MESTRTLDEIDAEITRTKQALTNVKGSETEVYARIVGYYRSVRNWNKGKRDEYDHRKLFTYSENDGKKDKTSFAAAQVMSAASTFKTSKLVSAVRSAETVAVSASAITRYELFARTTCPNCPPVKEYLSHVDISGTVFNVDSDEGFQKASELGVMAAPTVIVYGELDTEIARAHNALELARIFDAEPVLC